MPVCSLSAATTYCLFLEADASVRLSAVTTYCVNMMLILGCSLSAVTTYYILCGADAVLQPLSCYGLISIIRSWGWWEASQLSQLIIYYTKLTLVSSPSAVTGYYLLDEADAVEQHHCVNNLLCITRS